jgi:exodeoxyribonuclease-5
MNEFNKPVISSNVKVEDVGVASIIRLIPSQKQILYDMLDYIEFEKTDSKIMTLEGYAGTGKTTLLRFLIDNLKKYSIIGSAPTHKAVAVLKKSIRIKTETLAKLLGLRPDVNLAEYTPNNPVFAQLADPVVAEYNVLIVDECSMVNTELYKLILKEAKAFGVLVIFVGDPYQLPPVHERISPTFNVAKKFTLSEIIRQEEGHPLLELLAMARNDVANKGNSLLTHIFRNVNTSNIRDDIGYRINTYKSSSVEFSNNLLQSINEDVINTKYLAFTNDNVLSWNKYIRSKIIEDSSFLHIRDLLTGYNSILDNFNSMIIARSNDYSIDGDELIDYTDEHGLHGKLVQLKNIDTNFTSPVLFVLDHSDKENVEHFKDLYFPLLMSALADDSIGKVRSRRFKELYKFKEKVLLLNDITIGNEYAAKDLDFYYGSTIHKSQGSTYNNVFINFKDIIYDNKGKVYGNLLLRNKLIYVALSRTTKIANIII